MSQPSTSQPEQPNRWARVVATIVVGLEAILATLAALPHVFGATDDQRISIPLAVFAGLALLVLVWMSFGIARGISMAHSGAIVAQIVIIALVVTGWLTWSWAVLGVIAFVTVFMSARYVER